MSSIIFKKKRKKPKNNETYQLKLIQLIRSKFHCPDASRIFERIIARSLLNLTFKFAKKRKKKLESHPSMELTL